jgi:hypothetical protein
MVMRYETKLIKNAGSMRTTVPAGMVNLLELKEGDKLCWSLEMIDGTAVMSVVPKPKE